MEAKSTIEQKILAVLERSKTEKKSIGEKRKWSITDHKRLSLLQAKIIMLEELQTLIKQKEILPIAQFLLALNYKSPALCGTRETREIITELFCSYCARYSLPEFPSRWGEEDIIENQLFLDSAAGVSLTSTFEINHLKQPADSKKVNLLLELQNNSKALKSLLSHQTFQGNAVLLIIDYRNQLIDKLISLYRSAQTKRAKSLPLQDEIDKIKAKIEFIDTQFVELPNFAAFREFIPRYYFPDTGILATLFKAPLSMEPLVKKLAALVEQPLYEPNPTSVSKLLTEMEYQKVCDLRTTLQAECKKGWENKENLGTLLRKHSKIQCLNDILKCKTPSELEAVRHKALDNGALEGSPSRVEQLLSKLEQAHGIDPSANHPLHK